MIYKSKHEIRIEATPDPVTQSTRSSARRHLPRRRHGLADPCEQVATSNLPRLQAANGAATQPLRTHGGGPTLGQSPREAVSARKEVPLSREGVPATCLYRASARSRRTLCAQDGTLARGPGVGGLRFGRRGRSAPDPAAGHGSLSLDAAALHQTNRDRCLPDTTHHRGGRLRFAPRPEIRDDHRGPGET